jgi:hypothetical protein
MKWYLSKFVFQIICGDGNHTPQFDEQLRLIAASDEEEAFEKSVKMGEDGEDHFYNQNQQLVHWKFINVSELHRLTELIDGAELYSRINEVDDAEAYVNFVNQRAQSIHQKQSAVCSN